MAKQEHKDAYRRHVQTAARHAELLPLDDKHKLGLEFIAQGLGLVFVGFHHDAMFMCAHHLVTIAGEALKEGLKLRAAAGLDE
ncbi:hypothetical protein ACVIGB_010288 [Bradyrhizobium sp. USDA 4341]